MVDTLRADHVYGDRARTPSMDSLIDAGLSFTRAVPEAMPTVPARNAILSGRRGFPFRGWHDYRGLMNSPGWFPLREPQQAWTSVLRRAGYFTGYVTDNPFLGFSYSYEELPAARSTSSPARGPGRRHRQGRLGRAAPPLAVPGAARATRRPTACAATSPTAVTRATRPTPSPAGCSARASTRSSGGHAAAVRARRRHVRAARAVDAAAPLPRHVRRSRLARARARDAALRRASRTGSARMRRRAS